MFDLLLLALYLTPLLIPGLIALIIVRARRNTRRHMAHASDISALRGEVQRIGARLKEVESTVLDLQHSIGDVARVSGEPEMLLPARRAASEVAKPKEKKTAEVARPKVVPKPAAKPKPEQFSESSRNAPSRRPIRSWRERRIPRACVRSGMRVPA